MWRRKNNIFCAFFIPRGTVDHPPWWRAGLILKENETRLSPDLSSGESLHGYWDSKKEKEKPYVIIQEYRHKWNCQKQIYLDLVKIWYLRRTWDRGDKRFKEICANTKYGYFTVYIATKYSFKNPFPISLPQKL